MGDRQRLGFLDDLLRQNQELRDVLRQIASLTTDTDRAVSDRARAVLAKYEKAADT